MKPNFKTATALAAVCLLSMFLLPSCSRPVETPSEKPPGLVIAGLETYRTNGIKAAYKVWANKGALEADDASRETVINGLEKVTFVYGKLTGYEIVKVVKLSSSVRRVYAVLHYEKGPIYASFDCYQSGDNWYVTDLLFHTKANVVFPASLLGG